MKTTNIVLPKSIVELHKLKRKIDRIIHGNDTKKQIARLKRKIDKAVRKEVKRRLRSWTTVSLDYDHNHNVVRSAIKYARAIGWEAEVITDNRDNYYLRLIRDNIEEIAKLLKKVTEKIDFEIKNPSDSVVFCIDLSESFFYEDLIDTGIIEKLKAYAITKGVFLHTPHSCSNISELTFSR